ncbi:MAG: hypothetical protein ACYCU7_19325 [Acidimicrobiales bacterium]
MATREEIIDGLRQVADWLEAHPEIQPAYQSIQLATHTAEDLAAATKALGNVQKSTMGGAYLKVSRKFAGVDVWAAVVRAEVCTARVVGSETVTVPDPTAPMVTVTRDVVEWDCHPILGGAS